MANSPLVVIEKVEYISHNHVDTGEILMNLHKIFRAVKKDTAAEEALARENEELRRQLEDNGEQIQKAIKRIGTIISDIKKTI